MKLVKRGYVSINYSIEELEHYYPGPITNEALFKDFSKYLRTNDPSDPTNFVLKTKILEGKDYKLIPKKCWDILRERFEGTEIKRVKDTDNYSRKFIIKFNPVSVLILPPLHDLDPEAVRAMPRLKIYMQNETTFG